MRKWDGLVDRYIEQCETRGLAESTLAGRRRELERFGAWAKRRRPKPKLADINSDHITAYIRNRGTFHSKSHVASVVSHLRGVGEFLVQQGEWQSNPLRWMRGPKIDHRSHLPKRIGKAHLRRIWDAARDRRGAFAQHQALCVLSLLYGTGLRRGELITLRLCDWNRDAGTLLVQGHKTGKERSLPVGEAVWRCIEGYLPHRHNLLEKHDTVGEEALLLNRVGGPLSEQNVSALVKRLAKDAGVPHVTLHQFRHSCASDLLEAGVTLPEVQRMLGHACLMSTMRYAAVADPERAAAMAKHPLNDLLSFDQRAA